MNCSKCDKKDKEIAELKGLVTFHKGEHESWRKLFQDQRGGKAFNTIQSFLADERVENARLEAVIRDITTKDVSK
jgi:hypothetical protein